MFNTLTRMGASGAGGAYEIEKSVRLNNNTDDSRFEWTPSGAGNTKVFTFSCWVKRTLFGVNNQYLIRTDTTFTDRINFDASDRLVLMCRDNNLLYTTRRFRDASAWYHIVVNTNTDNGTAGDRHQIWINGVRETEFDANNNLNGLTIAMNAAGDHHIGGDGSDGFGGYMAEVHLIDGQQIDASNFGETDEDTGQWIPKEYAGSYGTNGFYLDFKDNSGTTSSTLGKDSSGNGNNFTPQNFSVSAGAGNDSFNDTPTKNWCTLNYIDGNDDIDVKNGGLQVYTTGGFDLIKSTFYLRTGKWYWEVTCDDCGAGFVGVSNYWDSVSNRGGDSNDACTIATSDGDKRINGSTSSYGAAVSDGDVMMFALDMDNGKFWAGKSGTWFNSGDPAAGSNAATTSLAGDEITPSVSLYDNEDYTFNFGANMDFAHTPPTGFKAINMENYPEPTIKNPTDYFNTVLYTGTGSSQTITGVGFAPNLTWIKKRNASENHELQDSVRGATKRLAVNTTDAESTVAGSISAFTSDGFTVVDAGTTNENTHTYAAWNWKESAAAGFDIVTYTGNGTSGRTISHGLGVKPDVMIVKKRSDAEDWILYCGDLLGTAGGWIKPNEADTSVSGHSSGFNGTDPTSSVFTVGDHSRTNENSATYVNYLWSMVSGFSKFGQYTGNQDAWGPFVWCGFKPRWIWIKHTNRDANWGMYDTKRDPTNPNSNILHSNLSNADNTSGSDFDILSTGFKVRNSSQSMNKDGDTIFFMAFAETPFNYANAH